ncbi:amidohydrolase family protein [Rhodococcus triatomae]|uniref:Cytosine/adenosine deaminase n=1 Tax=Rhodococcus triatomae TaxID=300028 RepID=A0A1G8FLE4_9NOCA|nr:amidohydrolase family protein [Rhodococcus triatomae]QNG19516.1 amidohydrolase family protein [Rhodococcus triatomae]QNG24569.1 amidohydrolase family protein [Rhodococcus triatomae]SDH82952.1 Cytosine/adenosine deaminase [Rhodococcus triatomae]
MRVTSTRARTVFDNGMIYPVHDPGAAPRLGHLVVEADGTISRTAPGTFPEDEAAPADTRVDLDGALVLPGFVSAHSHLWQSVFRGIADGCSTMGWIDRLHKRFGPHLADEDMYAFTRHGYDDLLRHGITTVCNHTHDFGHGPVEQWQAALDVPARTVYSFSSTREASADERLGDIDKFAHLTRDDRHRVLGISVNTTGLLPVAAMREEATLLRELGFGLHAHYLEDPTVAAEQQASFDDLLAAGRIGPDTLFAHFIHTTPRIRDTCAEAGAAMVWNPLSNGRLGSGIPDIPGYRDAGLRIGMGVDGQASADVADPFQNMRTGLYLLRALARDATVLDAHGVLRMHTLGSAEILGIADRVGSLEVGKFADFLVIRPPAPLPPDRLDLWAFAVLAVSAADITDVYLGGTRVGGGPTDRDPDAEHDCRDRARRLYRTA